MDLVWLVIPAAVGLFVLRTVLIARKLKQAGSNATVADRIALREAQDSLQSHRDHLTTAIASPKQHLDAAKALARPPHPHARAQGRGLDAMVEDFLPERRL